VAGAGEGKAASIQVESRCILNSVLIVLRKSEMLKGGVTFQHLAL
jgi:hypothetical protein